MSDSTLIHHPVVNALRGNEIHHKLSKRMLRGSVCAFALSIGITGAAFAQSDADGQLEELTVTGSRIERSGMATPTPVTVVSNVQMSKMDPSNMIMSLNQLPQFYNNSSPDQPGFFSTSPGAGNLDLRGLGPLRTLVLIDGRRVVPSSRQGSTDINVFPESLVKNVEIVTGGASAAYGADAVSGVVNFMLDKDFTGLELHAQGGLTARADHENYEGSFTFGHDVGSKGHFLFSAERYWGAEVNSYKGRDWYKAYGVVTNPDPNGPQRLIARDVVSTNYTDGGLILAPGSALDRMMFLPDGSYTKFIQSDLSALGGTASQSITHGGSGFNPAADPYVAQLATQNGRGSAFAYLDWDFSDSVTVYAQGIYGANKVNQANTPGLMIPPIWTGTIYQDNAYLPETMRQIMIDEGRESFGFARYSSSADIATNRAITTNEMWSGTLGIDADISTGGFFDGWKAKAYGQFGTNQRNIRQSHWVRPGLMFAAMDAVIDPATGETVCRAAMVGNPAYQDCVPVNMFGAGSPSPQAINYITGQTQPKMTVTTPLYVTTGFSDDGYADGLTHTFNYGTDKISRSRTKQWVADFSASGEVWEGFGAGSVFGALGATYREESVAQIIEDPTNMPSDPDVPSVFNDPANGIQGLPLGYTTGRPTGFAFSTFPNVIGSLHTKEVFGEVQVPIFANQSFAESLNFTGAIRWAGYSGSGTSWSWKYGLDWTANSSIRLRGTMSRDVRAATLSERFDRTANAVGVDDPEFGGVSVAVGTTTGGNPNVAPEKADTVTIGAVFTPSFMSGFNMSIDWYDIKIKGAIGQLGAQRIVDDCFNGAANLCAQITRDPISNQLLHIDDIYQNVNQARVSGVDVEMSYTSAITFLGGGAEILNMRLFGTWLDENSTTNIGAPKLDRAGETGSADLPEIKLNANIAYSNGPFEVFIQERYIDSGMLRANYVEGVDIDNNRVKAAYYTDLNLSYTIETKGGSTWELFGNITNLLDKSPPVTANWSGFGGATQTNGSLFDILGRRFTMGFRLRM